MANESNGDLLTVNPTKMTMDVESTRKYDQI